MMTNADIDEAWRQRAAKSPDGNTCPRCFGGRGDHDFEPDPWGGAIPLCKGQEEEILESHGREQAANLRSRGAPAGWLSVMSGAALALCLAVPAWADQITGGPSYQDITVTKLPSGGLTFTWPQLDMPALDTGHPGLGGGGAWMSYPGGYAFTTGPESAGGLFSPLSPTPTNFKYSAGDGDTVIESVTPTGVEDHTLNPRVFLAGTTVSATGDADFLAAWPIGGADRLDFTINAFITSLDQLAVGSSESATLSTLEKAPGPNSPVPEPETLALLGAALAGLGLVRLSVRRIRTNGLGCV